MTSFLFPFWGKTDRVPGGAHSHLLAHCMSVGAAFVALMRYGHFERRLRKMARDADVPETGLLALLTWLAVLHDIGKLLPEFQHKCPWVLEELGLEAKEVATEGFAHGDQGFYQLIVAGDLLADIGEAQGWSQQAMDVVSNLWRGSCAHHGHHVPNDAAMEGCCGARLRKAALRLCDWTRELVESVIGPLAVPVLARDKPLVQFFSGLVALADWIGSDEETFPFIPIPEFEKRYVGSLPQARELFEAMIGRARERVCHLGLDRRACIGSEEQLTASVFGKPVDRSELRPMQLAALEAAMSGQGPRLFVIEDAMGSGKTEAALLVAGALIQQELGVGVTFALPSRASADQTHERVQAFSRRLFGLPANVAHATSFLTHRRLQGEERGGNLSAEHLCEWITSHNKKAFLAPVCAATVDQLMLGAMDARHGFVRAACMARHIVIIDEVHAYDQYMAEVLDQLLHYLAACGTPVVLLSATLPKALRGRYVHAYEAGLGHASGSTVKEGLYPVMTVVGEGPAKSCEVRPFRQPRDVALRVRSEAEVYACLVAAAREGVSALVCNTVRSALQRFKALSALCEPLGIQVHLLHSRYRLCDREAATAELLAFCNKDSTQQQRRGHIVVATQVIEQSLDLDFDYMASEPAPIDLLMQRLGRLHRHDRAYRQGASSFDVIAFGEAGSSPAWEFGTRKVYGSNPQILDASLQWVDDHTRVTIPTGIPQAVDSVYDSAQMTQEELVKQAKGAGVALNFASSPATEFALGTSRSSETRDADASVSVLLVSLDSSGLPADPFTGESLGWSIGERQGVAVEFLDRASERVLKVSSGSGPRSLGARLRRLAGEAEWNAVLERSMKYPPFLIVLVEPSKDGASVVLEKNLAYSCIHGLMDRFP